MTIILATSECEALIGRELDKNEVQNFDQLDLTFSCFPLETLLKPVAPASTYYNIILELLQSIIWLPVVGNYADIDVYASILAYEILLNQRGKPARNYIPVAPNYSVPTDLRLPELEHKTFDFNSTTDQIIILDISKPETIHKFAKGDQILEIIDHHPGYEEYWQTHIGKRAIIEPIGAVATSIFEWWGECWDYGKMPSEIRQIMSSISPSYLISIISISEKQNYILTSSLELDNYFTQLLHLKSQNNWLVSNQLYLRKEIIAKLLANQTQESI